MYNTILCRYNEIATKGHNRSMFENRLAENMRRICERISSINISLVRGRMFIRRKDGADFTETETERLSEALAKCYGLDSFSFCLEGEASMESVLAMVEKSAPLHFRSEGVTVFRTRARRSDKSFPLDSKQIEIAVATKVEELFGAGSVKVDLEEPEVSIGIEMRSRNSLVYYSVTKAPGGLPVGSNAPVLALLSGGIDSPVACTMLMKRGCHVDYLTFHSFPYTPEGSLEKVKRLAAIIDTWQTPGTLYACNIAPVQKLIRDNCDAKYRTVLYRRMMMRIASILCERHGLSAIVTGESVGQVASQTIENMSVIERASDYLVIRPLCCFDKLETISRAESLGTFTTSIEPMPDSCTVFAPPSPVIRSKLHTVEFEESKIPGMLDALTAVADSVEVFKL